MRAITRGWRSAKGLDPRLGITQAERERIFPIYEQWAAAKTAGSKEIARQTGSLTGGELSKMTWEERKAYNVGAELRLARSHELRRVLHARLEREFRPKVVEILGEERMKHVESVAKKIDEENAAKSRFRRGK